MGPERGSSTIIYNPNVSSSKLTCPLSIHTSGRYGPFVSRSNRYASKSFATCRQSRILNGCGMLGIRSTCAMGIWSAPCLLANASFELEFAAKSVRQPPKAAPAATAPLLKNLRRDIDIYPILLQHLFFTQWEKAVSPARGSRSQSHRSGIGTLNDHDKGTRLEVT